MPLKLTHFKDEVRQSEFHPPQNINEEVSTDSLFLQPKTKQLHRIKGRDNEEIDNKGRNDKKETNLPQDCIFYHAPRLPSDRIVIEGYTTMTLEATSTREGIRNASASIASSSPEGLFQLQLTAPFRRTARNANIDNESIHPNTTAALFCKQHFRSPRIKVGIQQVSACTNSHNILQMSQQGYVTHRSSTQDWLSFQ